MREVSPSEFRAHAVHHPPSIHRRIDDIVELGLTFEIYNDIDRSKNPELRNTSKTKAATYHSIHAALTMVVPSDLVLVYVCSPRMALVGGFEVAGIVSGDPPTLCKK